MYFWLTLLYSLDWLQTQRDGPGPDSGSDSVIKWCVTTSGFPQPLTVCL